MGRVLRDAAAGGAAALLLAATSVLVLRGAIAPSRGAWLAVATLVAADLLRTGAGLNPMVSASFFEPSPSSPRRCRPCARGGSSRARSRRARRIRPARRARRRITSCGRSPPAQETLTPSSTCRFGVATALSPDLTMLVPDERVLSPEEGSCRDLGRIVPRLRDAGVRHVLSASPLDHPDLVLEGAIRPARTAPIELRVYATKRPLPFLEVLPSLSAAGGTPGGRVVEATRSAGRIEAVVESPGPASLAVREGWAPGWRATIEGRPVAVERTPGAQMAVRLTGGRGRVLLRYRPAGLGPASGISALALLATAALGWRWRRRPGPASGE